jgi:putative hydroxymethylpyrimidine transporter CytX
MSECNRPFHRGGFFRSASRDDLADREGSLAMSIKFQAPPEWGIEPVPKEKRSLGFKDFAVLWGDLGIGLLVILAGTFLVPGLGLGAAATAILVGTALGSFLLGLVGKIGSDSGRPTMALLRPLLGRRGSFAPTALNVLQLLGWAVFEFIIMGVAMNTICSRLFGFSSYPLWTAVSAIVIVLMGLAGPVAFVKQWLEKFAVWVALATGVWLTWHLLSSYDLRAFLARPGDGSLPYWQGVDLVIALPISWLPLVADYNRFAKRGSSAFWGTVLGFFVTGTWFLVMGAFLMLGSSVSQEPKDFATAIALIGGWGALLILLADETHNAWADLYSAAVSTQNIFPKARQRWLIVGFGALCLGAALLLDVTKYQGFLYLVGSLFIPLFGVLIADYFVLREREEEHRNGRSDRSGRAMVAWALGIVAYHVTNPSTLASMFPVWTKLVPQVLTLIGGSIPSFVLSFIAYLAIQAILRTRRNPA